MIDSRILRGNLAGCCFSKAYLYFDESKALVSKELNIFQQFLRNFLGWYKETHLTTIVPNIYDLTLQNPSCNDTQEQTILKIIKTFQKKKVDDFFSFSVMKIENKDIAIDYKIGRQKDDEGRWKYVVEGISFASTSPQRGVKTQFAMLHFAAAKSINPSLCLSGIFPDTMFADLSWANPLPGGEQYGIARPSSIRILAINALLQKGLPKDLLVRNIDEAPDLELISKEESGQCAKESLQVSQRQDEFFKGFGFKYEKSIEIMDRTSCSYTREYVYNKSILLQEIQTKVEELIQGQLSKLSFSFALKNSP